MKGYSTISRSLSRISNDFEPSAAAIPPGSLLNTAEVAALAGMTVPAVWRLCHAGQLRAEKHGWVWYVTRAEAERFVRIRRGVRA